MTGAGSAEPFDTEVLVVGAGPVGLALAGDLGWRGRRCIVVERGDGSIVQPKMDQVGIRTMEHCRRWGIVADVEASPYNRDRPQDNVYITSLQGWELGREPFRSMREDRPPPYSPQKRERCPQNMFDPILGKFARSQPGVEVRLQQRFLSLRDDADGVSVQVRDERSGRESTLCARFLVGADGGRSRVREALGIPMTGRGLLTHTTNVVFRTRDLDARHRIRPGYRYIFIGEEGTWATLVAIDGHDRWRLSLIGSTEPRAYSEEELRAYAHRALGEPFELEIESVLPWQRQELVAVAYGRSRCFIAGDAAHLTSPTGGLGMNTGIGDAVDLGWKLSAVLEGWGGPGLLASYEAERRPIAQRIVAVSTENLRRMKSPARNDRLLEGSDAGRAVRERVGAAFAAGMKHEWYLDNVHLGYRYRGSPVIAEEPEDPQQAARDAAETAVYTPTTEPGRRAPHAWLSDGRSTHDAFGRGYVLVDTAGSPDAALTELEAAAAERGLPLRIERWTEGPVKALYQRRYVLVRPDDIVCWRGDRLPADPAALLARVTGH